MGGEGATPQGGLGLEEVPGSGTTSWVRKDKAGTKGGDGGHPRGEDIGTPQGAGMGRTQGELAWGAPGRPP